MTNTAEQVRLTADVVALATRGDGQLCVLLIRRARDPYAGRWALPGGHVNPGEDTAEAARRELAEETGLHAAELTQVGVYATPGRDPRGRYVSVAYTTLLQGHPPVPTAGDDAAAAQWCPVDGLHAGSLAFDHHQILTDALGGGPAELHRRAKVALDALNKKATQSHREYEDLFHDLRGALFRLEGASYPDGGETDPLVVAVARALLGSESQHPPDAEAHVEWAVVRDGDDLTTVEPLMRCDDEERAEQAMAVFLLCRNRRVVRRTVTCGPWVAQDTRGGS